MSNLFSLGNYVLHSGVQSDFKIDCDALRYKDLHAIAHIALKVLPPFSDVYGIPKGGTRLAEELTFWCDPEANRVLIVDDVCTTGTSFYDFAEEFWGKWDYEHEISYQKPPEMAGLVIFARGPCPDWVTPLFTLNSNVPKEHYE